MPERVGGATRPVADKNVARTFGESNVTVSTSGAAQIESESIGLNGSSLLDDFEDGDKTVKHPSWSGWTDEGGSGTFSVGSTQVYAGSYSAELATGGDSKDITATRDSGYQPASVSVYFHSDQTGDGSDNPAALYLYEDGGTIGNVRCKGDGQIDVYGATVTEGAGTWSDNTWFQIEMVPDFGAGTFEVLKDGNSLGTFDLKSGASAVDEVFVRAYTGFSGSSITTYVDNVDVSEQTTSGTAYVEWPMPADVFGWDVATFTRTLDAETVDVYVEEAQGSPGWTEIAGPIARGDSLPADPANNIRFRVELSRSTTSNHPTLDSLARRWKL